MFGGQKDCIKEHMCCWKTKKPTETDKCNPKKVGEGGLTDLLTDLLALISGLLFCTYRGNFLLAMCTYSVNFLTGRMLIAIL